jgi:hypothetical protein
MFAVNLKTFAFKVSSLDKWEVVLLNRGWALTGAALFGSDDRWAMELCTSIRSRSGKALDRERQPGKTAGDRGLHVLSDLVGIYLNGLVTGMIALCPRALRPRAALDEHHSISTAQVCSLPLAAGSSAHRV